MVFGEIAGAMKEAIQLAGRVENLAGQISDLSVQVREESKDVRIEIKSLSERIVRIEALVEYAEKFSASKRIESK